ncbi:MAG: penicillin-insensitive murein endopeptidase [Myxococcota bacterium]|nr:penicillin-insensitive murein endopeptidase [Myxococcota bacterium]
MTSVMEKIQRRYLHCMMILGLVAPVKTAWAEIPANVDITFQYGADTWLNPVSSGRLSPSDPLERAALRRAISRLTTQDKGEATSSKTGPARTLGKAEVTATFKAKVPSWPHSVAIGSPTRGWLANPVRLEGTERIAVRATNYGTQEMVDAIRDAVDSVHEKFPGTKSLPVGDLSRRRGGFFPPHVSHQNGRDADIGYYLKVGHHPKLLKHASARTMDTPRTWTFLESLLDDDKVEYIFVDYRLQRPLYRYARDVRKLSAEVLDKYFEYPKGRRARRGIIRHLKGHADHMHVRFYAPHSEAAIKEFVRRHGKKVLKPLPVYARIRSGDSLWRLSRRHRVSLKKLMRWNRISRRKILRPGRKLIVGWRRPPLPGR